jgi:hypothetical protein
MTCSTIHALLAGAKTRPKRLDKQRVWRSIRRVESLSERICSATGASAVTHTERLQRLWSGYGEIVRVTLRGAPATSVIVKLVQPKAASPGMPAAEHRSHARKLQSYAVELAFYQHYAARCSADSRVATPILCEAMGEQWLFILEDLDAAGYRVRHSALPLSAAQACVSWLASFHATFVAEPPLQLWPRGTYWHLDTRPDELARMPDAALRDAATWLAERLHTARFQTLVHGDAKADNFCFQPDLARVAAVDFQYVGAGCGMQDLVYFLSCLDDRTCEAHAPALLDHYFRRLRAALPPGVDGAALEAEWRALYPIAWADLSRLLNGWAVGELPHGHAARMTALALAAQRA